MIDAKTANTKSKEGNLTSLRALTEDQITEAIDLGAFSCRVDHKYLENEQARNELMSELMKLGYRLRYDSGSSCRESYSHLYIEWGSK